jgi:hypothetical protein
MVPFSALGQHDTSMHQERMALRMLHLLLRSFTKRKIYWNYTEIAIGAHQERLCPGNLFPLYACEKNVGQE